MINRTSTIVGSLYWYQVRSRGGMLINSAVRSMGGTIYGGYDLWGVRSQGGTISEGPSTWSRAQVLGSGPSTSVLVPDSTQYDLWGVCLLVGVRLIIPIQYSYNYCY